MRTLGVDVSHWEGSIDWSRAAMALGFAYYKATDGLSYVDDQFVNNRDGCNAAGIAHAAYHYFQPAQDPVRQADHFYNTVKTGGYKRYIADFEEPGCSAANMKPFLDRVELLSGTRPAIYTSPGCWNAISPRPAWSNNYPLIVANYRYGSNPFLPVGWTNWVIWQFTDYHWFFGCNETADGNWFNGDLAAARIWFGNYREIEPPMAEPVYSLRLQVVVPDLRVRTQPSVLGIVVGHLHFGDVIEVADLGGSSCWAKIRSGEFAGSWAAISYSGQKLMEIK